MDEVLVPAARQGAPPNFKETDMTKTHTSTFDSIYRLAEIAAIAFMLSALPVAAVSLIAQSA
jgi:hypothetical protein